MRRILPEGKALIQEFEGLETSAYPDPGTGDEPITVCYGHTGGIRLGETYTVAECEAFLDDDLRKFEACVDDLCPDLNQGTWDT